MICLVGHGYIGRAIAHELRAQGIFFDWQSHNDIVLRGDVIVNAAGYTGNPNVDSCEDEKRACIAGNVLWPVECEEKAGARPVIHIGSGCVYQDDLPGSNSISWLPWREYDVSNFWGSYYSLSKSLGEDAIGHAMEKSYILRIRMPFSHIDHPKNLLTKLCQYPKLIDYTNSLTRLEDAAKVAVWFALNKPDPGIYNCTNPGSVTTREIADMMGLTKEWFRDEAEFLKTVKAPRSHCVLDTSKLEAIYQMPTVEHALRDCIEHLHKKAA